MNKKQQQKVLMLFLASFLSIIASSIIQSNGSTLMDFLQGVVTGVGIAGMLMTILAIVRYKKYSK